MRGKKSIALFIRTYPEPLYLIPSRRARWRGGPIERSRPEIGGIVNKATWIYPQIPPISSLIEGDFE